MCGSQGGALGVKKGQEIAIFTFCLCMDTAYVKKWAVFASFTCFSTDFHTMVKPPPKFGGVFRVFYA